MWTNEMCVGGFANGVHTDLTWYSDSVPDVCAVAVIAGDRLNGIECEEDLEYVYGLEVLLRYVYTGKIKYNHYTQYAVVHASNSN